MLLTIPVYGVQHDWGIHMLGHWYTMTICIESLYSPKAVDYSYWIFQFWLICCFLKLETETSIISLNMTTETYRLP